MILDAERVPAAPRLDDHRGHGGNTGVGWR